jgi:hypothetical protein
MICSAVGRTGDIFANVASYSFRALVKTTVPNRGLLGYDATLRTLHGFTTQKMEVAWTSETLISYHITQSHNSEDLDLKHYHLKASKVAELFLSTVMIF